MRNHPIAMILVVALLSPYILAAVLLWVVAYVLAVGFDMLGGRR